MAQPHAFDIEELTGQRRRVTLRGRALPYQGVPWPETQRVRTTWYPGNPVATQQVLGPELGPTRINGTWKDRFIGGQAEVRGFDEITTAEALVKAFRELMRGGNLLRVQWGPEVRFGIMSGFEPRWIRQEDVVWEAEFTWQGEQETAPRAALAPPTEAPLREALTAVDDDFVFDPPGILPDYRAILVSGINDLRERTVLVFDGLRAALGVAQIPLSVVAAVTTAVESVRLEAEDEIGRLVDTPYTAMQLSDRVIDVFAAESWRRTVSFRVHVLRGQVQRRGRELELQAVPGVLTIIKVPGDTNLRQLALTYYGSADDWQLIADVNGLVGSDVEAGTLLVIPPPPARAV